MDDLNGLDWSSSTKTTSSPAPVTGSGNYYSSMKFTPPPGTSDLATPIIAQGSGVGKSALSVPKSSTPDSFANLVSFSSAKSTNKLSLQEQQAKLQAEKARKDAEEKKKAASQFGHTQFWDGLANKPSGTSHTPFSAPRTSTPVINAARTSTRKPSTISNGSSTISKGDDSDLFAAFKADTRVDNSSHYPPPATAALTSSMTTSAQAQRANLNSPDVWRQPSNASGLGELGDDDDPFGLGQMGSKKAAPVLESADDDDVLGDLGKPVDEVKKRVDKSQAPESFFETNRGESTQQDPWEKAVAELVDMGFSAENSRCALTESGAGLDIQAAVGWLLNDAHRQAKQKSQFRTGSDRRDTETSSGSTRGEVSTERSRQEAIPAWMRQERDSSMPRRDDSRSPANSDNDVSKTAAAVGSNLLKTANSLWKTSQKKVQRAVADLQQEPDPSQPKWMRPSSTERQSTEKHAISDNGRHARGTEDHAPQKTTSVTDEALLLEADSRPPARRTMVGESRFPSSGSTSSRDQSPARSQPPSGRSTPVPRWQQTMPSTTLDARSRLSKQVIEEQTAQAYVSPSRRKKAVPPSKPTVEQDLLFGETKSNSSKTSARAGLSTGFSKPQRPVNSSPAPRPSKSSTPIPVRPKPPSRIIPSLSPSALASSTKYRLAGTESFKRGDYAAAHSSYSSSLSALPPNHPITIILLCNRSLTALKTGEPKTAVSDADTALNLIGPSRGQDEVIDLQGNGIGEGQKDMKEFWGKALMRKAEALEQMERWSDAGTVWREAVEAGVGGATAVQGRQRCEKALQPHPKQSSTTKPQKPIPRRKAPALSDLAPASSQSTEAVTRLRAANAAAEKADDEKFALSDLVDARISKWRDGRKDNLRALLGGMDLVLWEGSGWKKIGMHELVINGKVKINYMKAIAKVHPDKIPQNATTEMQMISASVFATLNEAWDKFKTENGM